MKQQIYHFEAKHSKSCVRFATSDKVLPDRGSPSRSAADLRRALFPAGRAIPLERAAALRANVTQIWCKDLAESGR